MKLADNAAESNSIIDSEMDNQGHLRSSKKDISDFLFDCV
jgi:hypothetical protein